jgi:hypothetical protein
MDSTPAPEAAPGASSSATAAAEDLAGGVAAMTLDERFALLRGIGEECIQEDELRRLRSNKPVPICYDGFEPSGRMHIAQVRSSVFSSLRARSVHTEWKTGIVPTQIASLICISFDQQE